jgi:hypothetical protein
MSQAVLCIVIAGRNLVSFYYAGDDAPSPRLVEPYMVAYTTADNRVLSAWFLGAVTESQEGQGWRDDLLEAMTNLVILLERIQGARYGYNPSGGPKLRNVKCRLW